MIIELKNESFRYETENIVRLFFPEEKIVFVSDINVCRGDNADAASEKTADEDFIILGCLETADGTKTWVEGFLDGNRYFEKNEGGCASEAELSVCTLLYEILSEATGKKNMPWGMLTGVRPVKLLREACEKGETLKEASRQLERKFRISTERLKLCEETFLNQKHFFENAQSRDFSLYVSVPFCPSRCSYCSFVSHSIESAAGLLPNYMEKLGEELALTAEIANKKGLRLKTVYFGGGTPTVLSAQQLDELIGRVRAEFDMSECGEFTVEAGRPDTISTDKLSVLAENEVNRISVNPQTLNDKVLENIGRRHTAKQFFEAYEAAKGFGFDINVDLIAGLEGDTHESFADSVDRIIGLSPANITVHTLTFKRGSRLRDENCLHFDSVNDVKAMVDYSRGALERNGYRPYYLYRQKGSAQALENVGYTLEGRACAYNVFIMDESHTILSAGCSGVTKLVGPDGTIKRIFNYKYPYEYINRFYEIRSRKDMIINFDF